MSYFMLYAALGFGCTVIGFVIGRLLGRGEGYVMGQIRQAAALDAMMKALSPEDRMVLMQQIRSFNDGQRKAAEAKTGLRVLRD